MLYIVPGPIGNLEDLTYRAVQVLGSVDYILAEDKRVTGRLLKRYEIETPLHSYHAFNEHAQVTRIADDLADGREVALVSDAGMPGISDPGFLLVREARRRDLPLTVLPGATAFLPALVGSGIPCDTFHFEGFLPHKKGRRKRLSYISELPETVILYESPHRLLRCLAELSEHCGPDRQACIAREISKLHEEYCNGSLAELEEDFQARGKVRGEFVIILAGK